MMYSKGCTETYTLNTYSSTDTSGTYVLVVDDGWKTVTVDDLEAIKIKEPAKEQDEPDTGERPAIWERPTRRPATVNRAGRTRDPRRMASTYG